MNPWVLLGGTLAYNYSRHLRGKSTICSTTRAKVPANRFLLLWKPFEAWLVWHIVSGYGDSTNGVEE